MHTIAILVSDGVVAFDMSTPIEVFGRTRLPNGQNAYRVILCASTDEIDAGIFTLRVPWRLDKLVEADTIILPGLANPMLPIPHDVLLALRDAATRGTRIASICVGAFTLRDCWMVCAQPHTGLRLASWHDETRAWMWMQMFSLLITGNF